MPDLKIYRDPSLADVPFPSYGTPGAAGLDLCAAIPLGKPWRLNPGERALIPTGLFVEVPPGHTFDVQPRSGIALKQGIMVVNSPGLVDEDYRGEVGVILFNGGAEPFLIRRGDRIAQAVVRPYVRVDLMPVSSKDALSSTERGEGGFGSTGVSTS